MPACGSGGRGLDRSRALGPSGLSLEQSRRMPGINNSGTGGHRTADTGKRRTWLGLDHGWSMGEAVSTAVVNR